MEKSKRNKTIVVHDEEKKPLLKNIVTLSQKNHALEDLLDKILLGDTFKLAQFLPHKFVDLLILDPPYNLSKNFGEVHFKKSQIDDYSLYVDTLLSSLIHTLKDTASIYICGDWYSSTSLHMIAQKYFHIHNRITWQREKGRGAKNNWKNAHEDIWFCTMSKNFVFHVNKVKTRKKVIAPYKHNGVPKDWQETVDGNFRDTFPSNFWDDITIPYWSMSENTEHPTQKPEKLIAKLLLASSNEEDIIFDPFVGSGTSCVVAKKLHRHYVGIDIDEYYACVSQKRLQNIHSSKIQGYTAGVFWDRNTLPTQSTQSKKPQEENLLW